MIDKVSIERCVLCKACSDACPTEAIQFTKEYCGFQYPQINSGKCIGCNRCETVCPTFPKIPSKIIKPQAFAAMNREPDIRLSSTSGGVFTALSEYVLNLGGFICGAIFSEGFSVKHIVTNKHQDLAKMRGSKYVQSDTTGIYLEVKKLLDSGVYVLFSGCPCQIAALKSYLNCEYDNLLCVDVICHGIPGESSWKTYMALQEEKYKGKIIDVAFRNKAYGWHRSSMRLTFDHNHIYQEPITSDYYYYYGFLGNVFLKESCYHCQFRDFKSGSDITLGDFWGAEVSLSAFDDNKGLSAVLVHTKKGKQLFDQLPLERVQVDIDTILSGNRNIIESPPKSAIRTAYYEYAKAHGEGNAMKKYLQENPLVSIKRKTHYMLRKCKHFLQGKKEPLY